MKLPYRRDDSFALPLGNGQFASSCIVACEHRIVVVALHVEDDIPLLLRVSDDALVLHRWKRTGRDARFSDTGARARNRHWIAPARAERLVAASLGAPHPRERKMSVLEVRSDNAARAVASLDDDTILAITGRLDRAALDALLDAVHDRPGIMVRLQHAGIEHLDELARTPMRRLTLATLPQRMPSLPGVLELTIAGAPDVAAVASACPNVSALKIVAGGVPVDLTALTALAALTSLDLSNAHVPDARPFASLQALRALRLSRVTGVSDAGAFSALRLRTVALEHLHEIRSVRELRAIETLEQLELLGLWQFEIADVEWTLERARLHRAEIDIGGRRKNVELYRRASWAYPWPFAWAPAP
jgi:hypothetical protein